MRKKTPRHKLCKTKTKEEKKEELLKRLYSNKVFDIKSFFDLKRINPNGRMIQRYKKEFQIN